MARPDLARSIKALDTAHYAGGMVAAMHQAIETKMMQGETALPEWTAYGDLHSPADCMLHLLSRVIGVAALGLGVTLTAAALAHFF